MIAPTKPSQQQQLRQRSVSHRTRSELFSISASQEVISGVKALNAVMPNPDPVLKARGQDIQIYRELEVDAHVAACIQSRKAGTLSLEWMVSVNGTAAESPEAKFLKEVFGDMDLRRTIQDILDAPLYGHQELEIYWRPIHSVHSGRTFIVPTQVIGKPQEWFAFDRHGTLRLKKRGVPAGVIPPARKFLVARHNNRYLNPYGMPVLSQCFWPLTFKRGGVRYWVEFMEKFGNPYVIEAYEPGAGNTKTVQHRAEELNDMVANAVIVHSKGSEIRFETAATSAGSGTLHREAAMFFNSEISKSILSQTLTTEMGDTGSYAASNTHLQVRQDVVDADTIMVEHALAQLCSWIVELNFGRTALAPRITLYEEKDVDEKRASRDSTLAGTNQIRFTKKYWMREYGFADDDIDVPGANDGAAVLSEFHEHEFGENHVSEALAIGSQRTLDLTSDLLTDKLAEATEQWMSPVMALANECSSVEEMQQRLPQLFEQMDPKEFEQRFGNALFVSRILGRSSTRED